MDHVFFVRIADIRFHRVDVKEVFFRDKRKLKSTHKKVLFNNKTNLLSQFMIFVSSPRFELGTSTMST
jgi:hypothetical protein